jgi:3-mercaptopyruvate sulfurtransferase SseA
MNDRKNAKPKAFASGLALILFSLFLAIPVLAGTGKGEFCPTCVDWTDLDDWLAKKAAYEQELLQKIPQENYNQETLLGDAGIPSNNSLVITAKCFPCRSGPFPAVFTYWLLKYLGHEKVGVLDGNTDDWAADGLNTSEKPATKLKTNYTPQLKPELLDTYDFVVSDGAQIVDARPSRDFGIGSISGAVNISSYENVIETERRLSLAGTSSLSLILGICERKESTYFTERSN